MLSHSDIETESVRLLVWTRQYSSVSSRLLNWFFR